MRNKPVIFSLIFGFLLGIVILFFLFLAVWWLEYQTTNSFPEATPEPTFPQPTSSASPTPPTSTPPTSLDVVEEIVSNLEWGNIAFDTPKKMKFEEPKIIELLLSPTKSVQELQSFLKSHEQAESARIQISNRMEADLSPFLWKWYQRKRGKKQPPNNSGAAD